MKGVQFTQEAYQIKAPARRIEPPQPFVHAANEEDPIFAQMHAEPQLPEADAHEAAAEATRIIDEASEDARRIVEEARANALQLLRDAEERSRQTEADAKREGFEQGTQDGRAAASAEMDEMIQTMRGLVEMARGERHKIIESAEPELVRMAIAISERILHAHVAVEPAAVLEMTRSAIARVLERETVTIRVNPADIELMREHREQLMAMNDIDNLRLIEDQRVDRGGVIVETEGGTIDAKITTQLREVRRLIAVPSSAQAS